MRYALHLHLLGMKAEDTLLTISSHFSYNYQNGIRHYEIRNPFETLSLSTVGNLQLHVMLQGDASAVKILWGSEKLTYRHAGNSASFIIPASFLDSLEMKLLCTTGLKRSC